MKIKILHLMFICIILFSCTKEGEFTVPIDEDSPITNTVLLKSGTFIPTSGISVNGDAELRMQSNVYFIKLSNFNISSGPDLKVYLSKSNTPTDFVNIGALENNKSIYNIPDGLVSDEYPYVLIHCQQYNHLFAIAKLN